MEDVLRNRVAESGIQTLNLELLYPKKAWQKIDLKDYLFHGLILKEKDFREALKNMDWTPYQGCVTLVYCSTDAILPVWAFMLVAKYLQEAGGIIFVGTEAEYLQQHYAREIDALDLSAYDGQRVVIKGCSDRPVPPSAYAAITARLLPTALSIMYGEPCSTVPIYKKAK